MKRGRRTALLAVMVLVGTGGGLSEITHGEQDQLQLGAQVYTLAKLLDEDKPAFGLLVNIAGVGNAPRDAIAHSGNSNIDFVMYDMEHGTFDVSALRTYMQFLLSPGAASKRIVVRIPSYGRDIDKNAWMVKQVLDSGAHGVILPHL